MMIWSRMDLTLKGEKRIGETQIEFQGNYIEGVRWRVRNEAKNTLSLFPSLSLPRRSVRRRNRDFRSFLYMYFTFLDVSLKCYFFETGHTAKSANFVNTDLIEMDGFGSVSIKTMDQTFISINFYSFFFF